MDIKDDVGDEEIGGFVHADASFLIGSAHEGEGSPCQDYALSGNNRPSPFSILSDGCSQSGRTDVGARILALVMRRVIGLLGPESATDNFLAALLALASQASCDLGLETGDLDATLSAVLATPGGGARAFLFGDGVISARGIDGTDTWTVNWAGNMPGYPSYLQDPDRLKFFIAESESVAIQEGRAPFIVERRLILPDGEIRITGREDRGAKDGLLGLSLHWEAGPSAPDVVAALSDGVFQVSGIPWHEVVAELTAIKTARNGAFATRRMARAMTRFLKLAGRPADDISMAAIAAEAIR